MTRMPYLRGFTLPMLSCFPFLGVFLLALLAIVQRIVTTSIRGLNDLLVCDLIISIPSLPELFNRIAFEAWTKDP